MKAIIRTPAELMDWAHQACRQMQPHKPYKVTIERKRGTRTLEQNAYLWGVVYRTILDAPVNDGQRFKDLGWTDDDLHQYFLGEHFGWSELQGMSRTRLKPICSSSKLYKDAFSDYLEFIIRWAAERGVVIPDPE